MTHKMQRLRVAALVLSLAALIVSDGAAQTGKIDDDLQRAQEILNQVAIGGLDAGALTSLEEELARIQAHEYVVRVKLEARKYTAGSGYYPVTVSKPGLLEPPVVGRLVMPIGTARRAKSQLSRAYATLRARVSGTAGRRVAKAIESIWIRVDNKPWYVSSDDVRLQPTAALDLPASPQPESGGHSSSTLRVPDDFDTIQQALNSAKPGDTVMVSAGSYVGQLTFHEGITLRGAGAASTTVTSTTGPIVVSRGVQTGRITGLGFYGAGLAEVGMELYQSSITVDDCEVADVLTGIAITNGEPVIRNVRIRDIEGSGLSLNSAGASIVACVIQRARAGIHAINSAFSEITDCSISDTGCGLALGGGSRGLVESNTIIGAQVGIDCWDSAAPRIRRNVLTDNTTGISVTSLSAPDLGTQDDPGLNQITGSDRPVHYQPREQGTTLIAKHNWWGSASPDTTRMPLGVIYEPFLTQPPTSASQWQFLAQLPLRRSVQSMAVTDDRVLYIGEDWGKVYRLDTRDPVLGPPVLDLPKQSLDCIAVVGDAVFVGGWNAGIWRSLDDGVSWEGVHEGKIPSDAMAAVVVGSRLYIGNNAGVVWTDDLGESWAQSQVLDGRNTTAILVMPDVVYTGARAGGGISRSTDGLASWVSLEWKGHDIYSLGYAGGRLYTTTIGGGGHVTEDGGQSWSDFPDVDRFVQDGPALYAVEPISRIRRWSAATDSWEVVAEPAPEHVGDSLPATIIGKGFAYAASETGALYVHKLPNGGKSDPIVGTPLSTVVGSPNEAPDAFSPTAAWQVLATLPVEQSIRCIAVTDAGDVYAGQYEGRVHRITRTDMAVHPPIAVFEDKIIEDIATVGDVVFVCTHGTGVWRSLDRGLSWRRVGTNHIGNGTVAEVFGRRLYVGHNPGISWTDDLGETWLSSTTPHGANVTAIIPDSDAVYVGARALGGVYMGMAGASAMSPIGLDGQYITFIAKVPERLYAVGNGAFVTSDDGATWLPVPGARAFHHDGDDVYMVSSPFRIHRWSHVRGDWMPVTAELPASMSIPVQGFTIRNGVAYVGTDQGVIYAHRVDGGVDAPVAVAPQVSDVVHIPDPVLERAVREAVGKTTGVLTSADIAKMTGLSATGSTVASLTGIEHAVGLQVLDVNSNRSIENVTPLAGLIALRDLGLHFNRIRDIRPLAGLTGLTQLNLAYNKVSEVQSLERMTQIEWLDLVHNDVADARPLLALKSLRTLRISENPLNARSMAEYLPELARRGVNIDIMPQAPVAAIPTPSPEPVAQTVDPVEFPQTIAVSPASTPVPATALIVGISAYDHHANLVNPTVDAQAVSQELREVFGVDTTTLLDATKVEFLTALHELADREYAEDEQLLVFFSGHGYFDERIRRGYLAMRDSKPVEDDPFLQSFVSHEDVRVLLERLDCNHVLLVVDSCFSGTLDPMVAMASGARPVADAAGLIPKTEYIKRKLRYRTRRYITAGGKEYVPDGRPGQHSPFARQFLAALRTFGGADGILTLEEILLHLERVDPEPRTGELYGNEPGSSFLLVAGPITEDVVPKFAPLTVIVSPPDAQVRIVGGPPVAESLLKTLRVEPTATAERRYHLPLGTYRVRVGRDGYASIEREVVLSADGHRVEVRLVHP